MTQPVTSVDDLLAQIAQQQTTIQALQDQLNAANSTVLSQQYQLDQEREKNRLTDVVVTQATERHGAVMHRMNRLRGMIENPPKAFKDMTGPELRIFLKDFFDKITSPVPDDPNQDTV